MDPDWLFSFQSRVYNIHVCTSYHTVHESHQSINLWPLSLSAGTYCPTGSSQPIACPRGQYCEDDENPIPDGPCDAGFYCNGSASVQDPMPCSLGHYCPQGTEVEEPCSPGTFSGNWDMMGSVYISLNSRVRQFAYLQVQNVFKKTDCTNVMCIIICHVAINKTSYVRQNIYWHTCKAMLQNVKKIIRK